MKNDTANTPQVAPKVWEPQRWEYISEATASKLIVTEATTHDCFEFEKKAATLTSDAAMDWLISKYCTTEKETAINLVTASELGLSFPDKIGIIQIIKIQDGLRVEPLDGREKNSTKIFMLYHEDLEGGIKYTCEDPPFNHRASDYKDIPAALVEMAKNNILIEWEAVNLKPVRIGESDLNQLPYFVGDVGIKHYSQLLSRVPKKKKLPRRLDG